MKATTLFALALTGTAIIATSADAASWRASHPRRAEVNARLANENRRIAQERREGEITAAQAHDLHAQVHGIRVQERADASAHGGHITRAEQVQLNREANQVSRQIGH